MAKPTAELIRDVEHGPVIVDTSDGLTGTQHWRVDTHDEYDALFAAGLPQIEDAWSPTLLGLKCIARSTEYIGGTNDTTTGIGGWHRVRCEFSNSIDVRPLPMVGRSYTEILPRVQSVLIMRDIRVDPPPPPEANVPIENGRGTQRDIGSFELRVTVFPSDYSAQLIIDSMRLAHRQYLNRQEVLLPPLLKSGLVLPFEPRQLRYNGFEHTTEAGLLKIVHTLLAQPDHDWHWWTLGPEGQQLAPVASRIYEDIEFTGLW